MFDAYRDSYRDEVEQSISFVRQDLAFFTEAKANQLLDVVARRLGPPAALTALDVGCGLGLTDAYLVSRFRQLHGVDVAASVVAAAAQANPAVEYQFSDGRQLPYERGAFDVTFTICVVHHVAVPERSAFVRELARVTRVGGLVVVFEHNPLNPLTRVAVSRCEFDRGVTLARLAALRTLVAAAGLEAVEDGYILFFPWRGRALRQIERGLARLPLGAQYMLAARA
jgi:SAM-dependent methyltransferase